MLSSIIVDIKLKSKDVVLHSYVIAVILVKNPKIAKSDRTFIHLTV